MALTEIEYGSLASSATMNKNFQYLENEISAISDTLNSSVATINSNVSSLNSNVSSLSEEISNSCEEMNSNISDTLQIFSDSGIYVTTYINGTSWYREYFADAEKTKRVWIEQGGDVAQNASVTFVRPMSNTNYTIKVQDINNTYIEGAKPASMSTTGFVSSFRYGCWMRWSVAGV